MSLSKHILEAPDSLVVDSLKGLCAVNPQLSLDAPNKVVYKTSIDPKKVALVSGGGSGHEPAHAGFVGEGILSAAVCGSIFASPNPSQVRRGIDLVDNEAGTLIVVKNYTGDVLNFGLAKEQYAAEHAGKKSEKVKFLNVGDDVAVGRSKGTIVGRRGLAGVVLVYKIAGAVAEKGGSLDEVYDIAHYVANNTGTIGVGLDHCHVPGTAVGESNLGKDEIEIGLGIHNESGNSRISPIPPLSELTPQILELITSTTDKERSYVPFKHDGKDEVVLFVNNLGGLSELEIGGVVHVVDAELKTRKIKVVRVISGTFVTSLNMPGFSVSLLLLPREGPISSSSIISSLDAPTSTPGWKWTSGKEPNATIPAPTKEATDAKKPEKASTLAAASPSDFIAGVKRACEAIIKAEPEITRMDTIAGDGDCGLTLKDGANGVLEEISSGNMKGEDLVDDIVAVAKVAEKKMGGTSGAIYSIFFAALAQGLADNTTSTATDEIWNKALQSALTKLYTYTRARPPSRTLIDPLASFIENVGQGYSSAAKTAGEAAEKTRDLDAKAGRSAYVDSDLLTKEQVPDPGAWGVRVALEAFFL